jgi:O-antigen biosynthesis protein
MQHCGKNYEYKIHLPGSQSFVGSNSSSTSGDLYTIDRRFNLADFAQVRNKRLLDIAASLLFIICFPLIFFLFKKPAGFFANCIKVLTGKLTWVGYALGTDQKYLPHIRPGAIQPYNLLPGYEPSAEAKIQMNIAYAQRYSPLTDTYLLLKNYRFLGGI